MLHNPTQKVYLLFKGLLFIGVFGMNFRVASIIFTIASVVTAGIFVTVALVMGYEDAKSVWLAIAAGIAASIPISFVVTNRLLEFTAKLK